MSAVIFLTCGFIVNISRILANAAGCEPLSAGRAPNFVLLDFVNIGEGKQAVDMLNGL